MTILDQFEWKRIEVYEGDVISLHLAWCYGEHFAVQIRLDNIPVWAIGSIPCGGVYPYNWLGLYPSTEDACAAIIAMSKVHNSWATLDKFSKLDQDAMARIASENNAITGLFDDGEDLGEHERHCFLNGHNASDYR